MRDSSQDPAGSLEGEAENARAMRCLLRCVLRIYGCPAYGLMKPEGCAGEVELEALPLWEAICDGARGRFAEQSTSGGA